MKKKILPMFFLLSLAIGLCIAVSGCSALKLKAPANLRVSDDGFLSWDEVDGAAAYRVFINDGVFDTDENRLDIFWLTDSYGEYFNQLRELYDKGELTNVINRIVESMNHQFLLSVVQEEFKSHDLGSSRQLLLKEAPAERAHILYDIDTKAIVDRLKVLIEVKERRETTVEITQEHIEKVKKYLFMLDLIVNCIERHETRGQSEHTVFFQPGMCYSIAKALVYSLKQDEYFKSVSELDKEYIATKILDDVKGRMLEDIVLLETSKAAPRSQEVFKFKFDVRGEYDMVIYDKDTNTCRIYEVKHSDKIVEQQARFLRMEELNEITEKRFGKITGKYVIYSGETKDVDGVQYVNATEYLKSL